MVLNPKDGIIDYFQRYGIILLVVSPTAKWTAKSVSNSNGVTTQMAMWKRIAIFHFIGNCNSVNHLGRMHLRGDICGRILNYTRWI
jgi:hypothetical protein